MAGKPGKHQRSKQRGKLEFGARFFRTLSSAATVSASAFATAGAVARSAALAGTRVAPLV